MKEEKIRLAEDELRRLSTSLRASSDAVLVYSVFRLILPPKSNVKEACRLLIRLHNSLRPLGNELPEDVGEQNRKDFNNIGKLLNIKLSE